MPIVLKSGSLNLPEPSGPVQACNGSALPLLISVRKQGGSGDLMKKHQISLSLSGELALKEAVDLS